MREDMLTGKVAQILNERDVAINIGKDNGVAIGMRFAILADRSVEIRDPDTRVLLGEVPREKVVVQVVNVEDAFSICTASSTVLPNFASALQGIQAFIRPFGTPSTDESLPSPLSAEERYVRIGDRVQQIDNGIARNANTKSVEARPKYVDPRPRLVKPG